jgi:hypothetical protein
MKKTQLVLYPDFVKHGRGKTLYNEFKHAWDSLSNGEIIKWCKDSVVLFGKVTLRRGKGLFRVAKNLAKSVGRETADFGTAVYEKRTLKHLTHQKDRFVSASKSLIKTSGEVLKNIIHLLRNNPKEAGPLLFLGVLGFFCGAGHPFGKDSKGFYDFDSGIPDLDIQFGGIGNHRNPFFHSIIAAAVIETMVFSVVRAANITYSHLPEQHDPLWDNIDKFGEWGTAFASGACTGIAYHLLIDGTLDGHKAMTGLPFSMPMEGHNAFFVANAAAEAIDLDKKKQLVKCNSCNTEYKVPSLGTGTKVVVNCKSCSTKFEVELI